MNTIYSNIHQGKQLSGLIKSEKEWTYEEWWACSNVCSIRISRVVSTLDALIRLQSKLNVLVHIVISKKRSITLCYVLHLVQTFIIAAAEVVVLMCGTPPNHFLLQQFLIFIIAGHLWQNTDKSLQLLKQLLNFRLGCSNYIIIFSHFRKLQPKLFLEFSNLKFKNACSCKGVLILLFTHEYTTTLISNTP